MLRHPTDHLQPLSEAVQATFNGPSNSHDSNTNVLRRLPQAHSHDDDHLQGTLIVLKTPEHPPHPAPGI